MSVSIIALSDSHTTTVNDLPVPLREVLQQADLIVHAGDHTELSLLEELKQQGQVIAVSGNMDSAELKARLPHRQIVTVNGKTVGVAHGSGAPAGIAERVRALFPENPDLIVFGHSHVPFNDTVDGTLMVNPGPANRGYATIQVGEHVSIQLISTS